MLACSMTGDIASGSLLEHTHVVITISAVMMEAVERIGAPIPFFGPGGLIQPKDLAASVCRRAPDKLHTLTVPACGRLVADTGKT